MWKSKDFNVKKMLFVILCVVMFGVVENSVVNNGRSEAVSFKQCLLSSPTAFGYCIGMEALSKLQTIDNEPEFDVVDGVTLSRDDQQVREAYNFIDRNPGDFRSIVDSVGDVFSRKNLKWDMSFIYPGLTMRVAPSLNPAGVLEFVMDPLREAHSKHTLKEASTGQLIARQFLLPFLAGFKFNVAALIPIIFGLIALAIKKALFLSKLGLIISTAIGLGTLLFGSKYPPVGAGVAGVHGGYPTGGGHLGATYGGGHYGYGAHNRFPDEDYLRDPIYRAGDTNTVENQVRFLNPDGEAYSARSDKTSGRNFAWNEDEMKKKPKT